MATSSLSPTPGSPTVCTWGILWNPLLCLSVLLTTGQRIGSGPPGWPHHPAVHSLPATEPGTKCSRHIRRVWLSRPPWGCSDCHNGSCVLQHSGTVCGCHCRNLWHEEIQSSEKMQYQRKVQVVIPFKARKRVPASPNSLCSCTGPLHHCTSRPDRNTQ